VNGALSVIGASDLLRPPHCERLGVPPTPQIGRYRTAKRYVRFTPASGL